VAEVEGVPRVQTVVVLTDPHPSTSEQDALCLSYIPGLHLGATFLGRIHASPQGVKAWPFVWGTFGVDLTKERTFPTTAAASEWLVDSAEEDHQRAMSRAMTDQGETSD